MRMCTFTLPFRAYQLPATLLSLIRIRPIPLPQALRVRTSRSPQWSPPHRTPTDIRPQIQWTLRGYGGLTILCRST